MCHNKVAMALADYTAVFGRCLEDKIGTLSAEFGQQDDANNVRMGFVFGSHCQETFYIYDVSGCVVLVPEAATVETFKFKSSKHVDVAWLAQRACEIHRCLPGGVSILGLYALSDKKRRLSVLSRLTKPMQLIVRQINTFCSISQNDIRREYIMLAIEGRKPIAFVFNTPQCQLRQSPISASFQALKLVRVVCHASLDYPLCVSLRGSFCNNFAQLFLAANKDLVKQILESTVVFGDEFADEAELFREKSAPANCGSEAQLFLVCTDTLDFDDCGNSERTCAIVKCQGRFHVKGTVSCHAFVPAKCSAATAASAIRQDIVESLSARTQLHYEGMGVIDSEKEDPISLHQFPRRIYAPWLIQNASGEYAAEVCDYLFEGDTQADCASSLAELFDMPPLNCEQVDDSAERMLGIDELEDINVSLPFIAVESSASLEPSSAGGFSRSDTTSLSSASARSRESSPGRKFNSQSSTAKVAATQLRAKRSQRALMLLAVLACLLAIVAVLFLQQ